MEMYATILRLFEYYSNQILYLPEIKTSNRFDNNTLVQIRDALKQIYDYYKSENKSSNSTLKKLHLQRSSLRLESRVRLVQMTLWQDIFETERCDKISFMFSYTRILKRKNKLKYAVKKVRNTIDEYNDLLDKIAPKLQSTRRYLENGKEEIDLPLPYNKNSLESKIIIYESELETYDDPRYSWMNDKKCRCNYIMGEIQDLRYYKEKLKEIINDVESFAGLDPNVHDAAIQLHEMERSCKEFMRKLMEHQ